MNREVKHGWKQSRLCYSLANNYEYRRDLLHSNVGFLSNTVNRNIKLYSTLPTNNETSLAKYLDKEIIAEQNLQKTKTIPSKIDDFEVALDGAEVTLTRLLSNEMIKINFSVNDSIGDFGASDSEDDLDADIISKPPFCIKIETDHGILEFLCFFADSAVKDINDIFSIDKICTYKGEKTDAVYSISTHVLDDDIYNLFMDWLDEKGITNEFVQQLSNFSTIYEHHLYISILSELKKFVCHSEQ